MKNKRLTVTRPDKCSTNSAGLSGRQDIQENDDARREEKFGIIQWLTSPVTKQGLDLAFAILGLLVLIQLLAVLLLPKLLNQVV